MIFKSNAQKGDEQYHKGNYQRAGEHFVKAELWQRAADSFAHQGDLARAVKLCEEHGLLEDAGKYLLDLGEHHKSSVSFEKAGEVRRAAEVAREGGLLERSGRLFEAIGDYRQAADCYFKGGHVPQAVDALSRESERLRQLRGERRDPMLDREIREIDLRRTEILPQHGRYRETAEILAEHGLAHRAAPMFLRAGAYVEAARTYLDSGNAEDALEAIERVRDTVDRELLAEIYLNCGRHLDAARIFADLGRFGAAASAYEGGQSWEEAARMWEREEAWGRAADLYMESQRFAPAGRCYLAAQQPLKAAAAFVAAGDHEEAARAYERIGDALKAGNYYLQAGLPEEAKDVLLTVEPGAGGDYVRASLILVPLLIDEGSVEGAAHRLELLRRAKVKGVPQVEFLYCRGRIAEAQGRGETAEKYYQQVVAEKADFRDARRRLKILRNERSATQPAPQIVAVAGGAGRDTAPVPKVAMQPEEPAPEPLPLTKGETLGPWWNGASFCEGFRHADGRQVSLVCFPADSDLGRFETFEAAWRRTASLDHPAVLKLLEVVRGGGEEVLVYEHFAGQGLEKRLFDSPQGPPSPLAALQIIVQLCEVLAGAHKLGLTHRWLSPRTVLADPTYRIKLVGLGLADVLERHESNRIHLGPEARGGGVAGPASDVYSLGRLAITLLQARMPQGWESEERIDADRVSWDSEVETTVPAKTRETLLRCLDHNPIRRPTMDQVQAALTSIGLLPGQMISERYEVLGQIGSGGMSRVYRARDRYLNDEVAIKTVLTPTTGAASDDEERLLREVQISRRISHPNVVRVHDLGRFPGGIFVSMELLAGPGLDEIIERDAPLSLGRTKRLLIEIAAALGEAHHLQVVHRDLKPGNVMLSDDGRVKVLDFGIARSNDGTTSHLTRTGEVIGSPLYMAPEQIRGKPLDGRCDLYALGVIAFTLLAGHEPFLGDSPTDIVLQHVHDPPPKIRRELPTAWADFVHRLMAKAPGDRYPNAEAVAQVLATLPEEA